MLELLGVSGELNIVFTDDSRIRHLNRTFRGNDHATDVLAFEAQTRALEGPDLIGDVIISGERAKQNAVRYKHRIEAELLKLIAHGLLHILGYDHTTESRGMRRAERTLLQGVASRFRLEPEEKT